MDVAEKSKARKPLTAEDLDSLRITRVIDGNKKHWVKLGNRIYKTSGHLRDGEPFITNREWCRREAGWITGRGGIVCVKECGDLVAIFRTGGDPRVIAAISKTDFSGLPGWKAREIDA